MNWGTLGPPISRRQRWTVASAGGFFPYQTPHSLRESKTKRGFVGEGNFFAASFRSTSRSPSPSKYPSRRSLSTYSLRFLRTSCDDADYPVAGFDQIERFVLHAQIELRKVFRPLGQEIQEIPLRHQRNEWRLSWHVAEIGSLEGEIAVHAARGNHHHGTQPRRLATYCAPAWWGSGGRQRPAFPV